MLQQISDLKDHILNNKEQISTLVHSPVKILLRPWFSHLRPESFKFSILNTSEIK